jgi:AraC-like DNA-binding protein
MIMSDFRSRCAGDIQHMLASIQGELSSRFLYEKVVFGAKIYGGRSEVLSKYSISFPGAFSYRSDGIEGAVAILTGVDGFAEIRFKDGKAEIRPDHIFVIGDELPYQIASESHFSYTLTVLSNNIVTQYCKKMIARPMEDPLRFRDVVAGDRFVGMWRSITENMDILLERDQPSPVAVGSIADYAVALLLEMHPHNYSADILRGRSLSSDRLLEARRFVERNAGQGISVADVASFVGCGMRALHHGFCDHLGMSPRALIDREQGRRAEDRPGAAVANPCASGKSGASASPDPGCGDDPSETAIANECAGPDGPGLARRRRCGGTLGSPKTDLLRHHINMSIGLPITVRDLARMVGMSSGRFAAAFRRAFGTSPAQYVIWERLKWACWLLVNSNDSIAAIACETGFNSQSYLTTALKGWNGQTPFELRKLSRSLRIHGEDLLFCMD